MGIKEFHILVTSLVVNMRSKSAMTFSASRPAADGRAANAHDPIWFRSRTGGSEGISLPFMWYTPSFLRDVSLLPKVCHDSVVITCRNPYEQYYCYKGVCARPLPQCSQTATTNIPFAAPDHIYRLTLSYTESISKCSAGCSKTLISCQHRPHWSLHMPQSAVKLIIFLSHGRLVHAPSIAITGGPKMRKSGKRRCCRAFRHSSSSYESFVKLRCIVQAV